ncbi:MAG: PLP-dependent aminotransferase family protein [Nanoarchaeota archaeon]|nr:PLP-dependent aminotransferase family protein [Nanoarchaeota archaeon]
MDYSDFFSERSKLLSSSFIRDILQAAKQPGVISLAGGLPDPDTFPIEKLMEIHNEVGKKKEVYQYDVTSGYRPLREELLKFLEKRGISASLDELVVTTGSQQGLFSLALLLLNRGDVAYVEHPTFVGALMPFKLFGAKSMDILNIEGIPIDENGMDVDVLEEKLRKVEEPPKFVYTIPTFQNPGGVVMSIDRRKKLLDLAHEYNFSIVEDDPYGEIRFTDDVPPSIKSMDNEGRVIYLGTFSKMLAPGFRVAFTVAPKEITEKIIVSKQAMDLHTATYGQAVIAEFMSRGFLEEHISFLREFYKKKRDALLNAMDIYFNKDVVKWVKPKGGLFTWIEVEGLNTMMISGRSAVEKYKVAIVPGAAFYLSKDEGLNMARVNYSYPSIDELHTGVKRLAYAIEMERSRGDNSSVMV